MCEPEQMRCDTQQNRCRINVRLSGISCVFGNQAGKLSRMTGSDPKISATRQLESRSAGAATALLLVAGYSIALAADTTDAASTFKQLDLNEDGQLDGIELRDRKWLSYDSDGDKEITRAEFLTGHADAANSVPAASRLARAASGRPTSAQEWNRWGLAYLRRGEDAHAMWAFAMGMRTDPSYGANIEAMSSYSSRFAKVSPQEPPPNAPDPTQADATASNTPAAKNASGDIGATSAADAPADEANVDQRAPQQQPAAEQKGTAQPAAGDLVYGDYVCRVGRWDVSQRRMVYEQKGYFRLNPDGTYRYLDGGSTGRYEYDANSRRIRWLSGHFAESGRNTTKFSPGNKVAEIDITFHTGSGDLTWGCGCNK